MARVSGQSSGVRISRRNTPSMRRVQSVNRVIAPRPVVRSAAAAMVGRARNKPSRVSHGSIPRVNIRIPHVDFNPGKAVGDFFSRVAPQDRLFKNISNRIDRATRR